MSKIQVWKCDHCKKKYFEDVKQYRAHLSEHAVDRMHVKKMQKLKAEHDTWWAENFFNKVKSLAQLQKAVLVHGQKFGSNGLYNEFGTKVPKGFPTPTVVRIDTFSLEYSETVSNSYNAPVGFNTNWGGREGDYLPRSYPGWRGCIAYKVESSEKHQWQYPGGSDVWKNTRIHSGTGGGGGYTPYNNKSKTGLQGFNYDFSLFALDWPPMAEAYDKAKMWEALQKSGKSLDIIVNEMHPAEEYI